MAGSQALDFSHTLGFKSSSVSDTSFPRTADNTPELVLEFLYQNLLYKALSFLLDLQENLSSYLTLK